MIDREGGRKSQLVVVAHREIRVGAKLGFIRPLDGHAYENHQGPAIPPRSQRLVELAEAAVKPAKRDLGLFGAHGVAFETEAKREPGQSGGP
jgi:hypothetical protein